MNHRLVSEVTRLAVTAGSGRLLMLHAAAVAHDGGVTGLVAASGTGKTTAARVLGRQFGYVTDELLAVDQNLRVHPFPKPLSIVTDQDDPESKIQLGPDECDLLEPNAGPLTLSRLLLLVREPGHQGPPKTRRLSGCEAAIALVPHACALPSLQTPLLMLSKMVAACEIAEVTYGEATQLAPLIKSPTGTADPQETWHPLPVGQPPMGGWSQGLVREALSCETEGLLLVDDVVMRVAPWALTVWLAAGTSHTVSEIVSKVLPTPDPSGEASAGVHAVIEELVRLGLLQARRGVA